MFSSLSALSAQRLIKRDGFLDQTFRQMRKHDERLRGLEIDAHFDRGVAHLTGAVDDPGELAMVRSLIGSIDGVLGVWDRVHVGGRRPVVVDLGCGARKQYPGNIGVDLHATPEVDIRADVSAGLPFADASVDRVFLVHILEHLIDFLPLLDEVHRVLRPDGIAHVLSPWWRYVNAVADPTHVRLLDVQTIKGICDNRPWYPLHAACDGASVFADLRPRSGSDPLPTDAHLARFFD